MEVFDLREIRSAGIQNAKVKRRADMDSGDCSSSDSPALVRRV